MRMIVTALCLILTCGGMVAQPRGGGFFASHRLTDSGFTLRKGNRLYQGT